MNHNSLLCHAASLTYQDKSGLAPQTGGRTRYSFISNHAGGKREGTAADLGPGPLLPEQPGPRSIDPVQLKVPGSVALARSAVDMAARRSTAAISSPNPAATRRP
jgi:hypothetical protein